jgi:hypothetical protein
MTGESGFGSQKGRDFILFFTELRRALGPIDFPMQWAPDYISLEVRWQGHEADHLLPSGAKFKNDGARPPIPHMPS